jgi:hypothetical protein
MFGAMDDAHSRVPGQLLQAEQHAVRREPGYGCVTLPPPGIQIVEPDVSDVSGEPVGWHAAPLRVPAECASRCEALIE